MTDDIGDDPQIQENDDEDFDCLGDDPYDCFECFDDDEDEDFAPDHGDHKVSNRPLYPGCLLTELESAASIMSFILRFQLPQVAIPSLLQLISLHCPDSNNCLKFHRLKNIFKNSMKSIERKSIEYHSSSYIRAEKTASYCCKIFLDGQYSYFLIDYFVNIQYCNCLDCCKCQASYFAIGENCICAPQFVIPSLQTSISGLSHISSVTSSIIPLNSIVNICYYISFEDESFISERINTFETV